MKAQKPRLRPRSEQLGEPLGEGFQILVPALPAKDKPQPGDEYVEDENGKQLNPGELAKGLRLTPARIAEMTENARLWLLDPKKFAQFAAIESVVAIQIASEIMKGPFIGPSANQQRLASADFVVKESQKILNTILKNQGVGNGDKGK